MTAVGCGSSGRGPSVEHTVSRERGFLAYIDDRAWCHGKIVGLTDKAFRVWVSSITYASGMNTLGILDISQQKLVGSTPKTRRELVGSELWDDRGDNTVKIHDWDDHNGKRDQRKKADRSRKKAERAAALSAGQGVDGPLDSPQDVHWTVGRTSAGQGVDGPRVRARGRPPDDCSDGSEGVKENPRAVPVSSYAASGNGDGQHDHASSSNGKALGFHQQQINESFAEAEAKSGDN